jgi:hypothetical protein
MFMSNIYSQYCQKFALHEDFGFLTDPNHQITTFDYEQMQQLCQLQTGPELESAMANFPNLQVTSYAIPEDNLALHDMLIVFLNKFLAVQRGKKLQDIQAVLHPNLCVPLHTVSALMNIKPAMVINISYNWVPLNNRYI